jgi:hypothetical protein
MLWEITEIVNGSISSVNWRSAGSYHIRFLHSDEARESTSYADFNGGYQSQQKIVLTKL